jgi:hypothetical protein
MKHTFNKLFQIPFHNIQFMNPAQFFLFAYACKAGKFLPTSFEFSFLERLEVQVGVRQCVGTCLSPPN